jgi:hypothetical protein
LLQLSVSLTNPCKKGLRSVQFLPHPESNSKYIQCSLFGQMFTFTCPNGLVWSQPDLTCVIGKRGPTSLAVIQETENAAGLVDSTPAPMITPTATAVPTITPRMTTRFTTTPTPIFTTSTVPSVQLVQANSRPSSFVEDEETDRSKNLPAGGGGRLGSSVGDGCDQISLTGSSFSLVNGLYGKVNENMYRRVDNLRLPGLIVAITNTKWCITYSFASSNLPRQTRNSIRAAASASAAAEKRIRSRTPAAVRIRQIQIEQQERERVAREIQREERERARDAREREEIQRVAREREEREREAINVRPRQQRPRRIAVPHDQYRPCPLCLRARLNFRTSGIPKYSTFESLNFKNHLMLKHLFTEDEARAFRP